MIDVWFNISDHRRLLRVNITDFDPNFHNDDISCSWSVVDSNDSNIYVCMSIRIVANFFIDNLNLLDYFLPIYVTGIFLHFLCKDRLLNVVLVTKVSIFDVTVNI